ncbi:MAG: GIY-YIG nuclease family protein [Sedimentisphaerales bacterium]
MKYYVYILADKKDGNIYVGRTNDLINRISEHKSCIISNYTKNTGIHILVYYEEYKSLQEAIKRERQIKKWKREWKINLIERSNPEWKDLYFDLIIE